MGREARLGLSEPTDEQLIHGYALGETEAFDVLVSRYERRLHEFASALLGDSHHAEDIVQEVFVRVHLYAGRYRYAGAPFCAWIYRIARNLSISRLRRIRRQERAAAPSSLSKLANHREEGSGTTSELGTVLQKALMSLPPDQRTVFILRDREGMSYEQIAKVAGARVGTVRSRLNRARNALARMLADYLDEEG